MTLHLAYDEFGVHILRQGFVRANSFVHSHATVVLAMGDQKWYSNLGDVVDRRDPFKELSNFRDGLIAILASACRTPHSRRIL